MKFYLELNVALSTSLNADAISNKNVRRIVGRHLLGLTGLVAFCQIMTACTIASTKIDRFAQSYQFERRVVAGKEFQHVIYVSPSKLRSKTLHVYLEGDGLPWLREKIIAADPTGSHPTALHLMSKNHTDSIYLGRPCYHGLYKEPQCHPYYWTHGRYSTNVVDSMAQALNQYLAMNPYQQIVFIGYSGGGVLAMLLAEHFPETAQVITVAANLDIDAWAKLHDFSLLKTSLNPARRLNLYHNLAQRHLAGGQDQNVPADIIRKFVDDQHSSNVQLIYFEDYDHTCCWIENWPTIINQALNPH